MSSDAPSVDIRGQRTLAAIVFTDGVNFSARMSTAEEHTLDLMNRDISIMRRLCVQFSGQVLKSTGDGLMMYFSSAVQAVSCALEIQKTIADSGSRLSPSDVLMHRIGIHLGDVFFRQEDAMGNGVNIAARLQTCASPGGICISQTVFDVVSSQLSLNAEYLGELELKNIQHPIPAYNITPTEVRASVSSTEQVREISSDTLIVNRYRVQHTLGEGGFGRTYLVADTQRFDELCVLKEFVPRWTAGYTAHNARELFQKEAGILYQINHPQIPKFLAWFEEKGRLFLVQEYVNGKTYAEILRERQQAGQVFSPAEIIQWLKDLLPVLTYIHDQGIIHRDISPDNIMSPAVRMQPMLIDFGLVKQTMTKLQAISSGRTNRESQGSFAGKVGYAPREQLSMGQCFPCSDLYALGVTALVLLTGQEPGNLMDPQTLEWKWQDYVEVGDRLAAILYRMLSDKPKDRYQSAQAVLVDLNALDQASPPPQRTSPSKASTPAVTPLTATAQPSTAPTAQSSSPAGGATITPEFRASCEYELARCIGPMARLVVNNVLAQEPHLSKTQLITKLASKIPSPQMAEEFRQKMSS
ncbi:protein kinase [Oscillatoria sp. FACHB-1407]|uniref:protein kinase domain-containing protein n=1 Tax=Oscillatoria sp. FACHB-1407 TaxID=2692847 RepID=UPI001686277C|nr:protein kinase [Oscillatoria sp. FACHB-1407]MBD2461426.1 protein kinase [Oscillatoria sp. FACHB-1407]